MYARRIDEKLRGICSGIPPPLLQEKSPLYYFKIMPLLTCRLLLLLVPIVASWSASTTFITGPPAAAIVYDAYGWEGLTEICGKCRIRVANKTTELFSFNDGQNRRFLFVCPRTGRLRMLDRVVVPLVKEKEEEIHRPNTTTTKQAKVCRIVRWQKYPACNLHKVRPIQRAELYRANYGRARTNVVQMGFVPKEPAQWQQQQRNGTTGHKWWWYFALRLNKTNCRLARLPTGASHIVLDLGARLIENAQPLYTCPLAKWDHRRQFGCTQPHIFLLPTTGANGMPMELGFSYGMLPEGGGEFRVNPQEREYLEGDKNVHILLGESFAGKRTFMEFAPYCDYAKSFVQIEPLEYSWPTQGMVEKEEEKKMKPLSIGALAELQQSLGIIKNGFKSAKGALEKVRRAIGLI